MGLTSIIISRNNKRLSVLLLLFFLLPACATAPVQEMSDARQAIQVAVEAGAKKYAFDELAKSEQLLEDAKKAFDSGAFGTAKYNAQAARRSALHAKVLARDARAKSDAQP